MRILILSLLSLLSLNSCAIGSAASAYSLMSIQSESLTRKGERDLINRVKEEVIHEKVFISHIKVITEEVEDKEERTCAE